MNRTELAKKVNLKDEDVKTLFDTIVSTVASGEEVSIHGFGSFLAVDKEARTARNPKTGETVNVPAHKAPKFKVSSAFKAAVK